MPHKIVPDKKKHHGAGHRGRLRERLLQRGGEALHDHELVEYLLTLAIPRRDTKIIAKQLIAHYGSLAALFAAVALRVTWLPDWLRALLMFGAIIFGAAGVVTAWNWITYNAAYRIGELSKARVAGPYLLSVGLSGLSAKQTDLIARHDIVGISGIVGDDDITWTIHAPGGDIPWQFMADFLEKSTETDPYLWPIRKHEEMGWPDSENLCTITTNLIKHKGWAEPSSGPYTARLTTALGIVAGKFQVEV